MPSLFEPCGLNQIYSLRYGTIPIVRATGGLDDTVKGYDPVTGEGNGFKFSDYTADALIETAVRALAVYRDPQLLNLLVRRGMREDYSWDASATRYLSLYSSLAHSGEGG